MYVTIARAILGKYQGEDYETRVDEIAKALAACIQPIVDKAGVTSPTPPANP